IGNLNEAFRDKECPDNVIFKGVLSDEAKFEVYRQAALAINPMFSGSGTNVKVIEYAGVGLPVVSTEFGMRGLDPLKPCVEMADGNNFSDKINEVMDKKFIDKCEISRRARELVKDNFDKKVITTKLKKILINE
ncbi:glycosyltransferase, partial [Patescibacteria group bacterium]|nr:glycosyltransferase [Patescibacteria group bacterium]